jgi:hypothetical protein
MVTLEMTPCPSCAIPLPPGQRFCSRCGAMIAPRSTPEPRDNASAPPPCWWCGVRPAEPAAEAAYEMHRDVSRSRSLTGAGSIRTTTRWRSLTAPIPRCAVCARVHTVTRRLQTTGMWLGLLLGMPVWLLLFAGTGGSGIGLLLGLALGFPGSMLWARLLGRWIGRRRGQRRQSRPWEAGASYPPVMRLIAEGWRPGKPWNVR